MHWMEVAERSNWLWVSDADYRTTGANRYRYTPPTHGFPCWADIKQYNTRYWGRSGGFGTRARHARRRKEKIFLSSLCLALRFRKPNLAWSPPITPVKSEGATIVRKIQFKLTLVPAGQCTVLQVKHLGVYCRLAANSIQNTWKGEVSQNHVARIVAHSVLRLLSTLYECEKNGEFSRIHDK